VTNVGTVAQNHRRWPPPGVYGCVRTPGLGPLLIRLVTRSWANHAFVVVDDACVIEAEPGGVRVREISEYNGCSMVLSTTEPMTEAQRSAVVVYAASKIGTGYNWTADTADGLAAVGLRWRLLSRLAAGRRALMCSELVAQAGQTAGMDWLCGQPESWQVTPAMLAARANAPRWRRFFL